MEQKACRGTFAPPAHRLGWVADFNGPPTVLRKQISPGKPIRLMHLSFRLQCRIVMMQTGMNLRHLRAFATIADAGGFVRASLRLHLSQPALSRQIHALEEELGIPLFDRLGHRVQLTSEGEDLLRRSRLLLAEADSLSERAQLLKGGETGILRVGATPQVIENLLSTFLIDYRHRHPRVEVHLVEDGGVRMHGRLERGDIHLALTATAATRFQARLLYPMHVLAVLSPRHRLRRSVLLEIAELADEPLLLLGRDFGSREWFDMACQVVHVRAHVMLESAAPHTLIALAATDYGIAILPSNVRVPRAVVRAVPLVQGGASVGRWAHIAWDSQRFQAPYAKQFVAEIVAYCRRNYPGKDLIRRAPPLPRPQHAESEAQRP
jgi:LysR family transcriptional regulator, cyn operon transcriptional activator